MQSAPQLVEKYNQHIASNPLVEMIHVSMDSDIESATKWAAQESFPWLTVLPEAQEDGLMSLNPDKGAPEYLLMSAEGEIVLKATSDEIFAKIKELSKKEAPEN